MASLNVVGDPSSPSSVAPDGAEESCCSQKKPHLPRAEVKVEGENRRLALTQGLTTEPFSLAHLPLLAYFYAAFVAMFPTTGSFEEATSGR